MNKNDLECGQKQPSKVPNALETVLGALSHYEEGFSTKSFLSYLSFFLFWCEMTTADCFVCLFVRSCVITVTSLGRASISNRSTC